MLKFVNKHGEVKLVLKDEDTKPRLVDETTSKEDKKDEKDEEEEEKEDGSDKDS